MAEPFTARVEGRPLKERVEETRQIIEEQGCIADVRETDGDFFIDEYTCPFPKTAEQDRAVCALHVEFVHILSGGETKLIRSLMRGERTCTYRIREVAAAATR
jgi:predicted ArsR family transcriptional regulator